MSKKSKAITHDEVECKVCKKVPRVTRPLTLECDCLSWAETELTSLRLLCKRILATYDSSAYAKGSEQELWREFKREVEK